MIDTSIKNKLKKYEQLMLEIKMTINPSEVTKLLKEQIKNLEKKPRFLK